MMSLHVIAKFEYLGEIREFVGEIARAGGFSSKDVYDIQLAVDEAASNIIEHAYEGVKNGVLEISCSVKDGAITIVMVDYGESFDSSAIPPPGSQSGFIGTQDRGTWDFPHAQVDGRSPLRIQKG